MDSNYRYNITDTKNDKVDLNRLTLEITSSSITIALDYINANAINIDIYFKAELSVDEQSILDTIISNHDGTPLLDEPQIVKTEILTEHLKYVESGNLTQGFFCAESVVIDVLSGESLAIKDISWKFIISIMSATIGVIGDMVNDELEIEVSPNTLVGALIDPMNSGDTTLYVSPTVIENMKIGYYIGLYDSGSTTGVELGRVVEIGDNYVVIDTPSTESANPGTLLGLCVKVIPYLHLSSTSKVEIGKDIPTGQRINPNTIVRIKYKNNNLKSKKVSILVEYLY